MEESLELAVALAIFVILLVVLLALDRYNMAHVSATNLSRVLEIVGRG